MHIMQLGHARRATASLSSIAGGGLGNAVRTFSSGLARPGRADFDTQNRNKDPKLLCVFCNTFDQDQWEIS